MLEFPYIWFMLPCFQKSKQIEGNLFKRHIFASIPSNHKFTPNKRLCMYIYQPVNRPITLTYIKESL